MGTVNIPDKSIFKRSIQWFKSQKMKTIGYFKKYAFYAWITIYMANSAERFAIYLCLSSLLPVKIIGEILLSLCILQWFILPGIYFT